jgi:hypothetical protein
MDATPAVLLWDRGALEAECDRGAQVREGVETYLGRAVFADGGGHVVRVRLSRVEEQGKPRVVARVSQEDGSGRAWGERSVSGDESCASLDEQLTLVVALMVDAPNTPAPDEPSPASLSPPAPAPPSDVSEPSADAEIVTAPSLQRPVATPGHVVVLGFGLASLGATPGIGVGGGLAVSVKPRGFWGIGLEGAVLNRSREPLEAGALDISLMLAAASLCPLQSVDNGVWWSACASVGAARLHARSRGLVEARSQTQWFALPGLSVRAARIFGQRWLLGGGVLAAVPVSPDRYVYRDAVGEQKSAFQPSSLVLSAHVGVGFLLN